MFLQDKLIRLPEAGCVSQTFAIRTEKQSFSGIHRLETLDFTGVDFQNALWCRPTLLTSPVKTEKMFSCFYERNQGQRMGKRTVIGA